MIPWRSGNSGKSAGNSLACGWHGVLSVGFLVLLIVVTLACARQPQKVGGEVEPYLPLQVGNQWSYSGTGSEYADYTERVLFQDGNRVQLKRENPGTTMALIYEVNPNNIALVYSQEEFYEDRNILSVSDNRQEVILQGPAVVGTTWRAGDRKYEITENNGTVKVPAGTFKHCLKVRSTFEGSDHQIIQYYARGVGLVKSEFISGNDRVVSELENYTIRR